MRAEYIDLPGGLTHIREYGGSGPTIVFVHGLGGSLTNWDVIGPQLATRGRAVAVDLPGFGLTPPRGDWSLETHTAAVEELIDHLGSPAILVGNSLGALISQMVASRDPERVAAMVLISPAAPPRLPDPHIHWPTARRILINALPIIGPAFSRWMIRRLAPRDLIRESLARISHKPGRIPLHLVEDFVDLAATRRHLPWAAEAVPMTGQAIRTLFLKRGRWVEMIRGIRAPTLVVQGTADPIVSPTAVTWMCHLRPDWTLVHLQDTGHTPQIDAPVRLMTVVGDWLDETVSDAAATA